MSDSQTVILQDHVLIQQYLTTNIIPELPHYTYNTDGYEDAIFCFPTTVLIDPHHGLNDLVNRKIRAVGIPTDRFTEDALRILR